MWSCVAAMVLGEGWGRAVYHSMFEPWSCGSHLGIFLGCSFSPVAVCSPSSDMLWQAFLYHVNSIIGKSINEDLWVGCGGVLSSREQNACPGYLPNIPLGRVNHLGRWAHLNRTRDRWNNFPFRRRYPSLSQNPAPTDQAAMRCFSGLA